MAQRAVLCTRLAQMDTMGKGRVREMARTQLEYLLKWVDSLIEDQASNEEAASIQSLKKLKTLRRVRDDLISAIQAKLKTLD